MSEPLIRPARDADTSTLTEIAGESKGHWGYPKKWMALWRDSLTLTPTYISEHPVYVGEIDRRAIAFYALVGAEARWELDHLWVRPEYVGRGIGTQLFHHAVAHLKENTTGAILGIESEPKAEGFYLRMGARRVREISREWQGLRRTLPYLEFVVR